MNNILNSIKKHLAALVDKVIFIFNKQLTIKKMYEPSIKNRLEKVKLLEDKLKKLNKENTNYIKEIDKVKKENTLLKSKIDLIKEFIINSF